MGCNLGWDKSEILDDACGKGEEAVCSLCKWRSCFLCCADDGGRVGEVMGVVVGVGWLCRKVSFCVGNVSIRRK